MILERLLLGNKYGICGFCMKKTLPTDTVFHKDGISVCKSCAEKISVAPFGLMHKGIGNVSYIVAPLYYTGLVRDAIINLKFGSMPGISKALGYYLTTYLSTFEDEKGVLTDSFDCIMPVPLSKERFFQRGYNQAELIAREVSKAYNIPVDTVSLIKIKDTLPQSHLTHVDRGPNLEGAYHAFGDIKDKRILLVDDVITTGNTVRACADALVSSGATSVAAISVAYGSSPQHSPLYHELFT